LRAQIRLADQHQGDFILQLMGAVGAVLGPRQQALVVSWDGVAAHFGIAFDVCRTWNRPLLTRITRLKQAGSITSSGIETILGNSCVPGDDFHAAVAGC